MPNARRGRPMELAGGLRDLAEAMGGVTELAAAAGVDRRTLLRWSKGEREPGGPARLHLATLAQKHGLKPPFPAG